MTADGEGRARMAERVTVAPKGYEVQYDARHLAPAVRTRGSRRT